MPGLWARNLPACGLIPLLYLAPHDPLRPNSMQPKPNSFLRVFTETGPLVALAVVIALLVGIAGPASAQFFDFNGFGNFGGPPQRPQPPRSGGGWFGGDFFASFQQQAPQAPQAPRQQDFSRAPPPVKRD